MLLRYLLSGCSLSFYFLHNIFQTAKIFILMKYNLSFIVCFMHFVFYLNLLCLMQHQKHIFLFCHLKVSILISMIHFELIFYIKCEVRHILFGNLSLFEKNWFRRLSITYWTILIHLSKTEKQNVKVYFWTPYFVPNISLCQCQTALMFLDLYILN